ncbi:MAG: cytochrome c [Rhodospirillaceae bacterium]|nr:cytochrome c [Rhodospirillaceae bacterium]
MFTRMLFGAIALVSMPAAAAEPSAARGRELYNTVGCAQCHGTEGQGSNAGLKLAPDPLPAEAIAQFIRATNTTMPPYSEAVLPDADVADIAAFLATIPASRPVERIPLLNALKPGR